MSKSKLIVTSIFKTTENMKLKIIPLFEPPPSSPSPPRISDSLCGGGMDIIWNHTNHELTNREHLKYVSGNVFCLF